MTNKKILSFIADETISTNNDHKFKQKIKNLFYYGMYDIKLLNNPGLKQDYITYLHLLYYQQKQTELENEIEKINEKLERLNFDEINADIQGNSNIIFKDDIFHKHQSLRLKNLRENNYKSGSNFSHFTSQFPIILSTAYSLMPSIPIGYALDYLIIDEASQLELVPGIIALGCAKNVIIVGDRKQLPHIPNENIPQEVIDIDSDFNYVKSSMLDSAINVYNDAVPMTLLKEHYRCDPMIIKFCNDRYYHGELVPLTKHASEEASLILIETSKGNHMRYSNGMHNIRELDSLSEETIKSTLSSGNDDIGFIAPYRAQVREANKRLDKAMIKDTVHKFQGREHDSIIFSTVLDKKSNDKDILFVDSPNLINVAVSRAKKQFILVSDVNVFKKSNHEISELIRYMEYYTEASLVHESKVISVFDLLYKEFSEVLVEREQKLKSSDSQFKSEQIIASLLRDILLEEKYNKFDFKREYRLKDLVNNNNLFNEEEQRYINHASRCDFLIHYKMGNVPAAVIEVDGTAYHNELNKRQTKNDQLKVSILEKADIPIIRLRTNESGEEGRIKAFLDGVLVSNDFNDELHQGLD